MPQEAFVNKNLFPAGSSSGYNNVKATPNMPVTHVN